MKETATPFESLNLESVNAILEGILESSQSSSCQSFARPATHIIWANLWKEGNPFRGTRDYFVSKLSRGKRIVQHGIPSTLAFQMTRSLFHLAAIPSHWRICGCHRTQYLHLWDPDPILSN